MSKRQVPWSSQLGIKKAGVAMKELLLNGKKLASMDDVHDLFARELAFPDYYGRNLDALFDCLQDYSEPPIRIRWSHYKESTAKLGNRSAESLLELLKDMETEVAGFTVVVEE
ncbi:barnase inhibitor [Paenibacillus herberti]|uniref:Barnase inhibitor n=2 Tax=Paenibacillus herberti TaxID=1619309 RepID=A0A229P3H4_9BACL|nr:barnase inhibitor [Paenibacillus herberti]